MHAQPSRVLLFLPGLPPFACAIAQGGGGIGFADDFSSGVIEVGFPPRVRGLADKLSRGSATTRVRLILQRPPGIRGGINTSSSMEQLKGSTMKSLITAIALALAAVTGSLHAMGKSCSTCCKDKDCYTCCKGKCDECAKCNK